MLTTTVEVERARDALHSIPPDLSREEWHAVGRAAIAAGLPVDDIVSWSSTAANFKSEQDVRSAFRTVKAEGGTGPGTLFKRAIESGWVPPESDKAKQGTRTAQDKPRKAAPGMNPAEVLGRSEAATWQHPYIASKHAAGVPLDTLRVLPVGDPLVIGGDRMAGALVVPVYATDGTIQSAQLIPMSGKKMNLPGCPMAGGSHVVGTLTPDATIYIVEGLATGWACWQATGNPAVVTFGWGNVVNVAGQLRQRDPSAGLVLVPDSGKESEAEKIALAHDCLVAAMPEGSPSNFDAGDMAARDGLDALELLLESAKEPVRPLPLLRPVSVFDVLTNPAAAPKFVWDGTLPRGVVSMLGAHGGTGKSTIALQLCVCAVLERALFGIGTECCKTLFVSLEDGADVVRHRLGHICRQWGINPAALDGQLHIVDGTENPELFAAESRGPGETTPSYSELRELVQREGFGLVAIDNASDGYGGDEIQRRQVRAFMRSLSELARLTNCAVLLLAHVDKSTSRARKAEGGEAYSGSTAWHNSCRSRLFLTRSELGTLTLEHQKSNFGKCRDPLTLEWPDGGLPQLPTMREDNPLVQAMPGRTDDRTAVALLKMISEFEARGQYCSPAVQSRSNVFAMLKSEPGFQALKLRADDSKRIVTQCHRAKWIEVAIYRTPDRKDRERWTLTPAGRAIAGLPAPSAPSAPSGDDGAHSATGAPSAPSGVGGMGEQRSANSGEVGAAQPASELVETTP